MEKLVKICGITTPSMAAFAAEAGADMIGIMLYPKSRRYVSLPIAQEIARAAREKGAEPVFVFVDASLEEILGSCKIAGVSTVQCYGKQPLLPEGFRLLAVNAMPILGLKKSDFLLLDHPMGGQGVPLDWSRLNLKIEGPWFLAGGLHPGNVEKALQLLNPQGVDVSSGVEEAGKKDPHKIERFIKKVKQYGA